MGQRGRAIEAIPARVGLDALDLANDCVERRCHQLVHLLRLAPLDEVRRIAVATEEVIQLLMADPGKDAGLAIL